MKLVFHSSTIAMMHGPINISTLVFMYSSRQSCPILIKLEFSQEIFKKHSNIKFHESPFNDSQVVPCAQTDRRMAGQTLWC